MVTLLSTDLQRPAGHHLTNADPRLHRGQWASTASGVVVTARAIARARVKEPGMLIHLRAGPSGSSPHLIGALILLLGLFSVLDIDGPSFLGMSTNADMAIEEPQDEIRHPGLDHGPQLPLPEAHRNWHGILAVSARQAHPAPTSPVVPPCDRISPGTLPRSTLPDAPPAG